MVKLPVLGAVSTTTNIFFEINTLLNAKFNAGHRSLDWSFMQLRVQCQAQWQRESRVAATLAGRRRRAMQLAGRKSCRPEAIKTAPRLRLAPVVAIAAVADGGVTLIGLA